MSEKLPNNYDKQTNEEMCKRIDKAIADKDELPKVPQARGLYL